jgi:regulator of protease activity HflC (stomatin/prohibitin superfamily)
MFSRRVYQQSRRLRLRYEHSLRVLAARALISLVLLIGAAVVFLHHPLNPLDLWEGGSPLSAFTKAITYALGFLLKLTFISLPLLVALFSISRLATRFVHDLYGAEDIEEAEEIAHRWMFGMPGDSLRPLMIVRDGCIILGAGSPCDRAGGPGFLVVSNNSAVVLEMGGRLTRVAGPGLTFLERFERIWEVIDLRLQHWPFTVSAMTKEGIPIDCQANVSFKIDDRFEDERGQVRTKLPGEIRSPTSADLGIDAALTAALEEEGIGEPLPYTEEAVFKAATSIWIRIRQPDHEEQLRKWTGRVLISETEGILRNILAQYRLDWLMKPPQPNQMHPREEIRAQLENELHKVLKVGNPIGARLLRVDLGRIDVKSDKIPAQWIEAWQAEWEQRAAESLAEGEAELARLEATQVQAQAEMVLLLIESIRPLVAGTEDFPPYLLAMRFVQTLRWMAYDPLKLAFLPPEILRTLDELEEMLGQTYKSLSKPPAGEPPSPAEPHPELAHRLWIEGRKR